MSFIKAICCKTHNRLLVSIPFPEVDHVQVHQAPLYLTHMSFSHLRKHRCIFLHLFCQKEVFLLLMFVFINKIPRA